MSNFLDEQGRTRVYAEAYMMYVAGGKPAENDAHRKKGHFRMETYYSFANTLLASSAPINVSSRRNAFSSSARALSVSPFL